MGEDGDGEEKEEEGEGEEEEEEEEKEEEKKLRERKKEKKKEKTNVKGRVSHARRDPGGEGTANHEHNGHCQNLVVKGGEKTLS